MARQKQALYSFNRGLISALALAREDIKRVSLGASIFTNFIARVLGSMAFRQGWKYLGSTYTNAASRVIPFIFSTTDTSLIEVTNLIMRVWINDSLLTRIAVSSVITNPTLTLGGGGWTNSDEAGATSSLGAAGTLTMISNGTGNARQYQQITVAAGDQNKEHALRIIIAGIAIVSSGYVRLRVGSTLHGDEYINETSLGTGTHSISFTPTGNFYIEFLSLLTYPVYVNTCNIESSGVVTLPVIYSSSDLGNIRFDQSADIIYLACAGKKQQKIERRNARSYSIVDYIPIDGPFYIENLSSITISAVAITGSVALTASKPIFYPGHAGALFSLTSIGQILIKNGAALNDATGSLRDTGVGATRNFTIVLSGFFDGTRTIILERSFDNTTWVAVPSYSWTAAVTTSYTDGLDNQVIYYRLRISVIGGAGTTTMTLNIATGSIRGIVMINSYSSSTLVTASILTPLGGTAATSTWQEGRWSDYRGYPSAVKLHDGRLWWLGKAGIWGSVSDGYSSFDETILGDSAPIDRTIGQGPVDQINWAVSGYELTVGTQGSEISVRSSSLGEPLTPTNFNMKYISGQGSAAVEPVKIDQTGIFVQRGGVKLYQLSAFNPYQPAAAPQDLCALVPELGLPGIVRMAVQRQPDTRIHCVRSDGTVMLGIFDSNESVLCWSNITTSGLIEDVVVLPGVSGTTEDQVYYVVNRTINGSTVRYLEKWANEIECRGGNVNKQADSFILYSGAATKTITGLSSLEAQHVIVWGDGVDLSPMVNGVQSTYLVAGGQITLSTAVSNAVIGLPYTGLWQSNKLGEATNGTVLTAKKNTAALGLVCAYIHPKGLQYGNTFDAMFDMPMVEQGQTINPNTVRTAYDEQSFFLDGGWTSDLRLCLQAQAPRPVTVMACVVDNEVSI